MVSILLNDQKIFIEKNSNLLTALEKNVKLAPCYAVVLNERFVPRHQYAAIYLNDNDNIKIVVPMQGG